MFCDELGVVKAAGTNVTVDGGEGNYDGRLGAWREKGMHEFGEWNGECADGLIFVVVNDVAKKTGALADDEGGWEIVAIDAMTVCGGEFAKWANCLMLANDVIFTTIA